MLQLSLPGRSPLFKKQIRTPYENDTRAKLNHIAVNIFH